MNDIETMAKAVYQKYGDGNGGAQETDWNGVSRQDSLLSNGEAVSRAAGSLSSRRSGHVPAPLEVSAVCRLCLEAVVGVVSPILLQNTRVRLCLSATPMTGYPLQRIRLNLGSRRPVKWWHYQRRMTRDL